jgi:hypothetical protein
VRTPAEHGWGFSERRHADRIVGTDMRFLEAVGEDLG